jgi:transposase
MQSIIDLTGVSRNTLRKYVARFKECGLSLQDCMQLADKDLHDLFQRKPEAQPNSRVQELYKRMPVIERELKKRGVTLDLLWREYLVEHPDGFRSTQFKQHVRTWMAQSRPTMHIEHKAGDKLYIDFTGELLHVVDIETGVVHDAQVFVCILGASQLIYVEAVWTQTKEDLIAACVNALEYYGGSPDAIVPDNLRAAVTKSDRYEAEINRSFDDYASHYGMTVLPARAYRPRDKALVEGAVKIVYTRIFAPLRTRTFTSLSALNTAIGEELEVLNTAPFKGRAYSRRQLFEDVEREALAPLPRVRYELREEHRATVMKNGHVALGVDKHYYSVPHTYIGLKVKLMASLSTVDIYYQHTCIASHPRSSRLYNYTTDEQHLASTHKFISEWSAEKFLAWAEGISPDVHLYIQKIFQLSQHPEQAYKSCLGILTFAKRLSNDRLTQACIRALEFGVYNYTTIKRILETGLDAQREVDAGFGTMPEHDNIRGNAYYGSTPSLTSEGEPL